MAAFLRERYGASTELHGLEVEALHDIVVRCELTFAVGKGPLEALSVVVKAFRDERRATYAREVLLQLRGAGFGADAVDGIFVPEPLALVEDRLLVMEDVRAPKATAAARRAGQTDVACLAANALAKLHATSIETPRRLSTQRLLSSLREGWGDPKVHQLIEAVEARLQALVPIELVAIHTDYHLGQLLIEGGRVCLLDTGDLMLGDPAFDLANFRVSLLTRSRPLPELTPFLDAFTSAYVQHRGDSALARLPAYEAIVLLRRAVKRAERSDAAEAAGLIEMAGERLAGADFQKPSP